MEQNTPSVRLLDFIRSSPSCYHAIDNIRRKLIEKGYIELSEGEDWSVEVGGKYFVTRNSSSIIAFRIPERVVGGFMVVASHSDSPTFRVKPNPELSGPENYVRLNTERYGGMILDSWFDRPLSVAGRIMVRENGRIVEKLVSVDDDLLIIPHVAIHMLKSNDGIIYNPAQDLVPLFGLAGPDEKPQGSLMKIVAEAAGVDPDNILSHDLFLVNRQRQSVWGRSKEFISSPKLDDLQCAFSAFEAFTDSESDNLTNSGHSIPVMFVADNEEVGSATMQGAGSTFLADTLLRVTSALEVCGAKCDCFGASARIRRGTPSRLIAGCSRLRCFFPRTTRTRFTRTIPNSPIRHIVRGSMAASSSNTTRRSSTRPIPTHRQFSSKCVKKPEFRPRCSATARTSAADRRSEASRTQKCRCTQLISALLSSPCTLRTKLVELSILVTPINAMKEFCLVVTFG